MNVITIVPYYYLFQHFISQAFSLNNFYRFSKLKLFLFSFQCLKEAILKATGDGILDDLSRINFQVNMNDRYRPGEYYVMCYVVNSAFLQRMPSSVDPLIVGLPFRERAVSPCVPIACQNDTLCLCCLTVKKSVSLVQGSHTNDGSSFIFVEFKILQSEPISASCGLEKRVWVYDVEILIYLPSTRRSNGCAEYCQRDMMLSMPRDGEIHHLSHFDLRQGWVQKSLAPAKG